MKLLFSVPVGRLAGAPGCLRLDERAHPRTSLGAVACTRLDLDAANAGLSMLHAIEGGAADITAVLRRMRVTALTSWLGDLAGVERAALVEEFIELGDEISRVGRVVRWLCGVTGSGSPAAIVVPGGRAGPVVFVPPPLGDLDARGLGVDASVTGVGTAESAGVALPRIDRALERVEDLRREVGRLHRRMERLFAVSGWPPGGAGPAGLPGGDPPPAVFAAAVARRIAGHPGLARQAHGFCPSVGGGPGRSEPREAGGRHVG
jgi:hypothetical protein